MPPWLNRAQCVGDDRTNLTNGAFKSRCSCTLFLLGLHLHLFGVIKLIFGFHLAYLLVPFYCLGVVLTFLSTEDLSTSLGTCRCNHWSRTVPLVLAMGLGFGNAVSAIEGFGILSSGLYLSHLCGFDYGPYRPS